ncbi:heme/hemin ABC transporter substrate-binding protein [Parapedobacter koreensis]|uniref:Iron complex transport system substrate-binding protein n=1 Tax=Parapedobacter koreensis TaxID=332977 RepID=A0A1H7P8U9_9SPHI|nr:ABC transporter substrate-binding protein [Parapedobacter koreensis]SEL32049.1 iron complex transport system substrate-binding protein [Parapedobacter koreensis]
MNKNILFTSLSVVLVVAFSSCNVSTTQQDGVSDSTKIVSTNGTLSEILVALGFEGNIVGVDVASTYPASLQQKPKIGHNRDISAEGVLALGADLVVGVTDMVKPEVAEQIRATGTTLQLFDHEYSVDGAKQLIRSVADSLGQTTKGDSLLAALDMDLATADSITTQSSSKPKVLFIYARGTGTMMVSGQGTQLDEMIKLAGGENAIQGFTDFKPLTAEALVAANPDVILLFDSGLSSLGGIDGLLQVQGISQTNAGKNRKVVEMDGQFLTGFGPRLGKAIVELAEKIH